MKTQHKPKSEYKETPVNEIRKLKGELNKLKKENSRLRKSLEKAENLVFKPPEYEIEEEIVPVPEPTAFVPEVSANHCIECGSQELVKFRNLVVCKMCKHKTKGP